MNRVFRRICAAVSVMLILLSLCGAVFAQEGDTSVTVLFTHDLHSHFLPAAGEDGGEYGGMARLMTLIRQQKELYPHAILVDGGDFSMGSLFQTAYATSALELRLMGAMGYDVTTFGNHEFDYLPSGLVSMLNVAAGCGEYVPAIVQANYLPPAQGSGAFDADARSMQEALDRYGVREYVILERGGVYFVVFGLMGYEADLSAPNSGMVLEDPVQTAQRIVEEATAECVETFGAEPLVICLSHSGTYGGRGEDYELAQAVEGIHLIVSGHSHTTLSEPIQVGDTYIVSCGEYGKYLGVVHMDYRADGTAALTDYTLIPVDETVEEDPGIAALVDTFKTDVEENYLSRYGMTFDQVLTQNPYTFDSVDALYGSAHESTLGNLFSDAYKWAVENATGLQVDAAVTATGVIRESLPIGGVTVSDVFNAASLGVGTEGELVAVYLTGADLMTALEVDASVQPLMPSAQLFFSGVEYSFNTNRMIFNKVDQAMLRRADGTLEAIVADELYLVVTGMYVGQMLGAVNDTSYGLISITPRDAEGNPIAVEDLANYVVRDPDGNPVKEWYAIASYLQQMGGQMDTRYAQTDGRKTVYASWNPVDLLKNANAFTYAAAALVMAALALIVFSARMLARSAGKKKK